MCLGHFLFLFKTMALFIHSETLFSTMKFQWSQFFFKPLQSKGNYLSFYVPMCFVFGCFISCHPIQYLLSYQKEKSEGKKWHMFKFSSVISYLILVFKSYVGRGKQQVSNITLDEKQNNPKYVFNICKHQNPNLIHYILWLFYPVLIFFFFFLSILVHQIFKHWFRC